MKNKILYATCSEAVFRFHTTEPQKMQEILQVIAGEISTNNNAWGKQKVPLFETAEEYDSNYKKKKPKNMKELKKKMVEALGEDKEEALISGCAGLGDNDAVIKVNKKKGYFDLNIGNNDISPNTTGWTDNVQAICKCEEAEGNTESSKELVKKSRDCTCGITFFG